MWRKPEKSEATWNITSGPLKYTLKVQVAQLFPTLCNPMDCRLSGFSVPGILQARILEWVTSPFSGGSSQPRDRTQISHLQADSLPSEPPGKPKSTGMGSLSLLQRIFPAQELNLGLLLCRWILYQLSHQGSPRILEWLAYPFSSGPSQPRNWTKVSCFAGGFFTSWAIISEMKYHLFLVFSLSFCPLFLSFPNSNLHGYFMSDIIFSVL